MTIHNNFFLIFSLIDPIYYIHSTLYYCISIDNMVFYGISADNWYPRPIDNMIPLFNMFTGVLIQLLPGIFVS